MPDNWTNASSPSHYHEEGWQKRTTKLVEQKRIFNSLFWQPVHSPIIWRAYQRDDILFLPPFTMRSSASVFQGSESIIASPCKGKVPTPAFWFQTPKRIFEIGCFLASIIFIASPPTPQVNEKTTNLQNQVHISFNIYITGSAPYQGLFRIRSTDSEYSTAQTADTKRAAVSLFHFSSYVLSWLVVGLV